MIASLKARGRAIASAVVMVAALVPIMSASPPSTAAERAACSTVDHDNDGWSHCDGDCNDYSSLVFPGAPEPCDGIDNDCADGIDNVDTCPRMCTDPGLLVQEVQLSPGNFQSSSEAALTWTGGNFAVVWSGNEPGEVDRVYRLRITLFDVSGNKLGEKLVAGPTSESQSRPQVVWTGEEFGIAWVGGSGTQVYFARTDESGVLLEAPALLASQDRSFFLSDLIWTGRHYGALWVDAAPLEDGVAPGAHFAVFEPSEVAAVMPTRINESPRFASVAWTGQVFGILWKDDQPGNADVFLTTVSEHGESLGPPAIVGEGAGLAISWEEDRFGVVTAALVGNGTARRYSALSETGAVIQGPTELFTRPQGSLRWSIVSTGLEYGFAWSESPANEPIRSYFTTFDRLGSLSGPVRLLAPIDRRVTNVMLQWTGHSFGVTFKDSQVYQGIPQGFTYLSSLHCNCTDDDADGYFLAARCSSTIDCDDSDGATFPGAPQVCDGLNNDCDDPAWPTPPPDEADNDGDGVRFCAGDCMDQNPTVFPGALQLCDGINNDCLDPQWPRLADDEVDDDNDGVLPCAGDCADDNAKVFPGAPQICDGVHNDCSAPEWPSIPVDEVDSDGDGFPLCAGDCNEDDADVHPEAFEACNGRDDNCNTLVDEDDSGEDTDGDTVANACDNCRATANTDQLDDDRDTWGNACDNCVAVRNGSQSDIDFDGTGDHCDTADAVIYLEILDASRVNWQTESGFTSWNLYRGDLNVLRESQAYTQPPGSTPLAERFCGLDATALEDTFLVPTGAAAFYLVTGSSAFGGESNLGFNGVGVTRANTAPCP